MTSFQRVLIWFDAYPKSKNKLRSPAVSFSNCSFGSAIRVIYSIVVLSIESKWAPRGERAREVAVARSRGNPDAARRPGRKTHHQPRQGRRGHPICGLDADSNQDACQLT